MLLEFDFIDFIDTKVDEQKIEFDFVILVAHMNLDESNKIYN